ncbi:MAG: hypothetical protein U9N62_10585 [Thermotogota bacterium]|nr:hypothetical protein [Thermotogota bacterium]
MKKYLIGLTILTIFIFSGCIISNNFTAYHRLVLNAIANGSQDSANEYAKILTEMSESMQEKAVAQMIKGYVHFLSSEYHEAIYDFNLSIDYNKNEASIVGITLSHFMLNQYEMVIFQIDKLENVSNEWNMMVNHDFLTKGRIYEICALSCAVLKDKNAFDTLRAKIKPEKIQMMEGFFFE